VSFAFGYPSVLNTNTPPALLSEALLLDGSKQWKAKEGCYVVSTLNSDELPAGANSVNPIMHKSVNDTTTTYPWLVQIPHGGGNSAYTQLPFTISPTSYTISLLSAGNAQFQSFNHSGAFFSGLSNTTTLTVNAIYYIERFPSQQDSDLVVLARQSCRDDPIARELYSEIIREMPVGVPQRMNGLGEWFGDAVSSAMDFIAPVASAIPLPFAQTLGAGMKVVGNIAKSIGTKKESVGQTYAPTGSNVSAGKPKAKIVVMASKKKKKVPLKKK